MHYWFESYSNFAEWVGFACWSSCIGKSLRAACEAGLCSYRSWIDVNLCGVSIFLFPSFSLCQILWRVQLFIPELFHRNLFSVLLQPPFSPMALCLPLPADLLTHLLYFPHFTFFPFPIFGCGGQLDTEEALRHIVMIFAPVAFQRIMT